MSVAESPTRLALILCLAEEYEEKRIRTTVSQSHALLGNVTLFTCKIECCLLPSDLWKDQGFADGFEAPSIDAFRV